MTGARTAAVLATAVATLLAAAAPALAGAPRPDLTLVGGSEGPDTIQPGGSFRFSFTTANQGAGRAGSSTLRGFLSTDGARGDDIELTGSATVRALRFRKTRTQSVSFTVPATVAHAFYTFIACADAGSRVREGSERNNCLISGQRVGVGVSERGPIGAPGPEGPPGAPGLDAIGPAGTELKPIARTELDLGRATVDLAQFPLADGNHPGGAAIADEGSTQTAELARIGPLTVTGLCRQTTNGDDEPPGDDFEASGSYDEDGDEAKVLVTATDGNFSMASNRHGERFNVPAGTGTPGDEFGGGGEGQHQALAVARDPDPTTTASDGPGDSGGGGGNKPGDNDFEWQEAFRHASVFVAHSDGTSVILHVWAGIDILGIGDRCAFGGVVQVVNVA